jgi:hypothetical protein
MAKMDYNSINFRNSAIDKMNGKFGKGDEPTRTITTKSVTVKPSAEQVARVKGKMDSEINRMDAETHGYERGAIAMKTGDARGRSGMENTKNINQEKFFDYHAAPYKGKTMADTRSVYGASKKANEYAKKEYDKNLAKAPMEYIEPLAANMGSRKFRVKKSGN